MENFNLEQIIDKISTNYSPLNEPSFGDFKHLSKALTFEKGAILVKEGQLHLQQRIVSIQFETALQKYENLLNVRPDITQRVPLMHIASYLGITLETLSRIRRPQKLNLI